jgi:hypothetical protein
MAAAMLAVCACAGCRGESKAPAPEATMALTATPSPTPTPAPPLSAAQRRFVDAFVNAVNAKDAAAMRKLVMPEALACYNKDTEPYLQRRLERHLRYTIPPDYKVSFSPFGRALGASPSFTIPAQPTEVMQIEFSGKGGRKVTLPDAVTQEKGGYYLFVPCLTLTGAAHLKARRAKHEASMRKARQAYTRLQEPLRSQLATLLRQGKKSDAVLLCMQNLDVDRRTAIYLLDIIAGRESE